MKKLVSIAAISLYLSPQAHAATMIELNGGNETSQVWINDDFARFDVVEDGNAQQHPTAPNEIMADLGAGKIYALDHENKVMILVASLVDQPASPKSTVKLTYDHQGKGPDIAGFETQRYTLKVDGQQCYEVLFSKDAMKNDHVRKYIELMFKSNPPSTETSAPCEQGLEQMELQTVDKYGMPMKIVTADGDVDTVVTKIVADATVPHGPLTLPQGYTTYTMQQLYEMQMQYMQQLHEQQAQ